VRGGHANWLKAKEQYEAVSAISNEEWEDVSRPGVKLSHRRRKMRDVIRYSEAFKLRLVEDIGSGKYKSPGEPGGGTAFAAGRR
jgi:hypothetical protein